MTCNEVEPTENDCEAAAEPVDGVKVIVDAEVAPTIPRVVKVAILAEADAAVTAVVVPIREPPPAVIDAVTVSPREPVVRPAEFVSTMLG